jgi:glycosyltransferase involved in cell wall biosynthesis
MNLLGRARGQLERGGKAEAPICVMGLHRAVLGLGRGARLFQGALVEMKVETTAWDVSALLANDLTLPAPMSNLSSANCVVAHLNPIEHLHALALYRGDRPKRGFRVGCWAWETSRVPSEWKAGLAAVDEVWCPSVFTANAVSQLIGNARPVRILPYPIAPSLIGKSDRARFDLAEDRVTFFAACDLRSSIQRKNPLGAIEAFRRSGCGQRGEGELIVKVHGDFPGSGLSLLMEAASKVEGVRIFDAKLSAIDMKVLRSSIDVVLSPHRSEGFGLVLAEAMLAGKPVIATGWSGNMDFMDENSAALIHAREVPVNDPSGAYRTGNWAEPDLDHGAELIMKLANDPVERARLSKAGQEKMTAYANPEKWRGRVRSLLGIS